MHSVGDLGAVEPRFAIVGTAGHIDHGKTALVEALTGKNTDRLKEEKERGISIDIDFAPLSYSDGTLIGMVDVPGHERFIRNMVAGAAGIDGALIVVDAGEGPKPQTHEHIAILQMLGIRHAVVALTKCDLVDEEWLDLASEVVREALSETDFADAPIIYTSSKTGQGISELKEALHRLVHEVPQRDGAGAFRLPIDRVFSLPGHGTIVTGTVWRGSVQPGQTLEVLPDRRPVRVRGIQVHGVARGEAAAGQRAALNLTGIETAELHRGHVICGIGTLFETRLIDVQVVVSDFCKRPLRHRDRVHLHLGTAEVTGRVLLLAVDELSAGETSFAQILLEQPLVCETGDKFVIRHYSPMNTIGGGHVVHPTPARLHRRRKPAVLESLSKMNAGSQVERLHRLGQLPQLITLEKVVAEFGITREEATTMLRTAEQNETVKPVPGGWYGNEAIGFILTDILRTVETLHQKHRFSPDLPRSLVTSSIRALTAREIDWFLRQGEEEGLWEVRGAYLRKRGFEVHLDETEQTMLDEMLQCLEEAGLEGAHPDGLAALFPKRDRIAKAILKYAENIGLVVALGPNWLITHRRFEAARNVLAQLYSAEGAFALGTVRDALCTSRKVAVALLEYTDKLGWTERKGDVRILLLNVTDS